MNINLKRTYSLFLLVLIFASTFIFAQAPPSARNPKDTVKVTNTKSVIKPTDTIKRDTLPNLPYKFKRDQKGSLFLDNLSEYEIVYDAEAKQYIFVKKVGDYYVKHPSYMTEEEYKEYRLNKDMLDYFKDKVSAVSGKNKDNDAQKNLLPRYYVKSGLFENIFGGNTIEVNPTGYVGIRMGILYQKVQNPQLSERNRQSTTFDFGQEIGASLNAKVGKRLRVNANFDTQASFTFQNQIKLEYTPTEDDIIQKIEVGNISMPIQNSLVSGAQNLFGFKTQLQFGKTTVTGVFSQQKSQTRSVAAEGGATITEFDMSASNYDDNRHFFLSQRFRDDFNSALTKFPLINSSKQVTQIEVWVTNKNNTTEDVRSIVALADLGEGEDTNIHSNLVTPVVGEKDPSNKANSLNNILSNPGIRDISTVSSTLSGYQQGTDYTILENARKLILGIDFTLDPQLGYITLNRRLADSEILAVAFEYTDSNVAGENVFRVGELSTDGVIAPANLVVKLLRSEIVNTTIPMWDLMMKNIYALPGAYQLNRDGFRLEVMYQDDEEGVPLNVLQNAQTPGVNQKTLLNLLRVDRLDQSNDPEPGGDGLFDYVESITVNSQEGYVIFPTVEPFGNSNSNTAEPGELGEILTNAADEKYVFTELYDRTKSQAQNDFQYKDKYIIKGYFKTENDTGIPLGAFNVSKGSVKVTSGGRELLEGVDYVVDYNIGTVQVINPNLMASNAPIEVSVENNNGFNQQQRSYLGVDVQHVFSENFAIGGTIINMRERPYGKMQFGQESVNNTLAGFNLSYQTEVPKFTKWVNKLPNIDTDVASNFSIRADAAYLMPGTAKNRNGGISGENASYIDDFEGSQIPLDISSYRQWFLASVPQNQNRADLQFYNDADPDQLKFGKKRSQLAWYTIDRLFYGNSLKPNNIDNAELSRAEVRQVGYNELFPELDLDITQSNIVNTLDLAYFPEERGSYNFDTQNVVNGKFTDPENRWAGIMRSLNTTDFQQANVEYIQFWLMDPYENYSIKPEEGGPTSVNPTDFGGELYFNLGNISEDILTDNRRMYENGLPEDGVKIPKPNIGANIDQTAWSDIPIKQSLIYAFTEKDDERPNQDLGLDGLKDDEEATRFGTQFGPDPANDNYNFFRGSDLDAADASILTRYRNFNKTQGNSPTINNSTESYPTAASSFPDIEDINKDQTMSTVEGYFQYKVDIDPTQFVVGQNNIVDEKIVAVNLPDGTQQQTKWYQFRIPISTPDETVGQISDFNSIRFMRMFLTKFKIPVVLRFGELELVRGDWRRYTKTLDDNINPPQELTEEENRNFEVGVVNVQENENKTPIPYVLPPGLRRERLQGTTTLQEQNEQSLLVRINDLPAGETRAVFKNTQFDMRMFNTLKMFIHAEAIAGQLGVNDDDLVAIIRLGSDTDNNFYQYEVPLKITPFGATFDDEIWPDANEMIADLKAFGRLKIERISASNPPNDLYPSETAEPDARLRLKGNPNLGNIRTIMIGVKNKSNMSKSAELWFNELRVADYDNEGGWAAVVNADANFADFADFSVSGRANSQGFGSLEQTVNERSQEDAKQYDVISNINVGQLLPKSAGVRIPLNVSYGEEFADPKWNQRYQDVRFDKNDAEAESSRDYTKRRSLNLINVRKERTNPEKKQRFYDVENLSFSYAYNDTYHKDYEVEKFVDRNVRAAATYNYGFKPLELEPFKKSQFLEKNSLFRFIKDFNLNPLPTSISVNSNIIRSYNEQFIRSYSEDLDPVNFDQRRYLFDWDYNIAYDLTKSLTFTFNARNSYINDRKENGEPVVDRLFDNFFSIGRPNQYHQTLDATYKIPLNKITWFDFLNGTYSYTADFDWQATAPQYVEDIGNTIQNANTHTFSADLDMTKLYKRTGLTDLAKKKTKRSKRDKNAKKRDSTSKKIAAPRSRRVIETKDKTGGKKVLQGLVDVVTSVKKIKVAYSEQNGTILPGFLPEVGFLGRDNYNGSLAPTLGFVFGSQRDIRSLAAANAWLVKRDATDPYYSKTFATTHLNKLDINADVRPFKDLSIELSANKIFTKNKSQQIDVINGVEFDLDDQPFNEIGNFSISHFMLGKAFDGNGDATFDEFKANRTIIQQRLAQQSGADIAGFGENSQQVLIPAFLATYSGRDASKVKLSAFRDVPIPNWRLNYKGFMKFAWFKKHFRSFIVEHEYRSTYSVMGFNNNLLYNADNPYGSENINESTNNYRPSKIFSGVNLIEEFNPLIKVDMRMKNSFSVRAELKQDKMLNLNISNNTITEVRGKEYVLGLGYRFKDVKLKIRTGNTLTNFKGDINLTGDIGIRNNSTTIRSIDVLNNQVTGGQRLLSFKFKADYALNKNLLASFYYDQNSSRFLISTTFPRKSVSAGISIRYTIGN
ncbi:cell surface protein SprA [Aureibaculum sp. 2210JD6-5]|uniref:T9SS outer membrane translocon Sov/SprA n=1 Tax=Aureibaculum sp. 2210JD6-5 TaxID=3103957 RepID=UPI002AAD0E7A|nr:cell surface protein SprA [Aureibaculum sp. 2210JD6-5]MDY7394583.1 cell surface protein SprA [Aureibaculum sp. 2210JD6-5]